MNPLGKLNLTGNRDLAIAIQSALYSLGMPFAPGRVFFVMPSTDPGYADFYQRFQGKYEDDAAEVVQPSLAAAYAKMVSNRHDLVFLSANAAHAQTAMLDISKNRCHFIGMDFRSGFGMGARTRITMGVTTAATDIAVMQNTGIGNTFTGLKFDSGNTKDESLYAVAEGGEYAVYDRCEFYKSTDLNETAAAEVLNNGDSAQWLNSVFGSSANIIADDKIRPNMLLSATLSGKKMRDNVIDNCIFLSKAGGTEHVAIYGANATDVERMLLIKNSSFINNLLSAATPAHAVGFGAAQTEGTVVIKGDCVFADFTAPAQASVGIQVAGAVSTFATAGLAKAS